MSCESDAIYTIAVIGSSRAEENELEECRQLGELLGERISKLSQQCRVLLQWGACGGAPFAVLKTLADMELPNVHILGYQPYDNSGQNQLYDDDPDMLWCEIEKVLLGADGDKVAMHEEQARLIMDGVDIALVVGGGRTTGMEVGKVPKDVRIIGLDIPRDWEEFNENEKLVTFYPEAEDVVEAMLPEHFDC